MTTLAPEPLIVAMVQAATIMPVFLLALPGGAMADIVDRRVFLIGTQLWTILAATLLAGLTVAHLMTAPWLLVLTFSIGIGAALTGPAWSAIIPELVPREDLVQAIALNGIGFNLTRAIGPALAGFLILLGGSSLTFCLYAVSILAVIMALVAWRRERRFTGLPREHLISAMRAGMRFVRNTPAVQYAMVRTIAFSIPASAPWALLPLFVRHELGLGAGMYGLILGMMGIGGVTSGMLLPMVRGRLSRGATVIGCTLSSCAGIMLLGVSHHWLPAAGGMLLFGVGWTSAYATMQAAAQLVCPPWVRARSLAIYQLAQNGALTVGSFAWGVLGGEIGLSHTLLTAGIVGLVLAVAVKGFSIEAITAAAAPGSTTAVPQPEAPAAELVPLLRYARGRVMETVHYHVLPSERVAFLALMQEMRHLRGRTGALFWQVYEDVAHPEGWLEVWSMESWTDHLREATRLSDDDRVLLARIGAFQRSADRPSRYLAVDPNEHAVGRRQAMVPIVRSTAGLNSA
jgi:MFS family permease